MTKPSNYRKPKPLQYVDVRQMNIIEETYLQHRLNHLCIRQRLVLKLVQQDINSLMQEHRKLLNLQVCEPIATVDNAMREIWESRDGMKVARYRCHHHHTQSAPPRGASVSGKAVSQGNVDSLMRSQSSRSAPTVSQMRLRESGDAGTLSLLQLRDIACINSISERELASQREWRRQEREKLKRIQRETLRQKMQAFLKTLDNV